MAISNEEVLKVGLLGRIRLSEAEVERFAGQLSDILGYVERLGELDTDKVEPLAHALPIENVLRPDEPRESLRPEEAVAGAPEKAEGNLFRVPRVIDDGTSA
jgi:aspartyl-tRNA(Asn)/glutamyl-tRNA(Gln) amidotransferase subunit C